MDAFCSMTHPNLAIMKEDTIIPPNTLLWWVDLLVKLTCQAWGIIQHFRREEHCQQKMIPNKCQSHAKCPPSSFFNCINYSLTDFSDFGCKAQKLEIKGMIHSQKQDAHGSNLILPHPDIHAHPNLKRLF